MIKKFEQITELTIDEENFQVADMSEKVQDLVVLFNKFGADEIDTKLDVIKCQRALLTVHNDIIVTIREERDAAKAAEAESEDVATIDPIITDESEEDAPVVEAEIATDGTDSESEFVEPLK